MVHQPENFAAAPERTEHSRPTNVAPNVAELAAFNFTRPTDHTVKSGESFMDFGSIGPGANSVYSAIPELGKQGGAHHDAETFTYSDHAAQSYRSHSGNSAGLEQTENHSRDPRESREDRPGSDEHHRSHGHDGGDKQEGNGQHGPHGHDEGDEQRGGGRDRGNGAAAGQPPTGSDAQGTALNDLIKTVEADTSNSSTIMSNWVSDLTKSGGSLAQPAAATADLLNQVEQNASNPAQVVQDWMEKLFQDLNGGSAGGGDRPIPPAVPTGDHRPCSHPHPTDNPPAPTPTPIPVPGDTGSNGGGTTSGSDTGNGSGSGSGSNPGSDTGNGSGSGSGNTPGSDTGNGSGTGSGNNPGSDTGNGSGSGSGSNSGTDMSSIFTRTAGVSDADYKHSLAIANALPEDMKKTLLANGVSLELDAGFNGGPQGTNDGTQGQYYVDSGMADQAEVHELYEMYGQISNGGAGSWSDSQAVALSDKGLQANGGRNEFDLNDTVGNVHGDGDHLSNAFTADFFATHGNLFQDSVGGDLLQGVVQDDPALCAYVAKAQGLQDA